MPSAPGGRLLITASIDAQQPGGAAPVSYLVPTLLDAVRARQAARPGDPLRLGELIAEVAAAVEQRAGRRQRVTLDPTGADFPGAAPDQVAPAAPEEVFVLGAFLEEAAEPHPADTAPAAPATDDEVILVQTAPPARRSAPEAVVSGGFYQPGAQVSRDLFQAAGDIYINESGAIDWETIAEDYRRSYKRTILRFVTYLAAGPGATVEGALRRYLRLRIQDTSKQSLPAAAQSSGETQEPGAGETVLLTGAAGSGKTTFLLYHAYYLARLAIDDPDNPEALTNADAELVLEDPTAALPLYLSLRGYTGGDRDQLLRLAALENAMPPDAVRALWDERQIPPGRDGTRAPRPLRLLLDGLDEVPSVLLDPLLAAIRGLIRYQGRNTLIIASRTGAPRQRLLTEFPEMRELTLLPLNDAEASELLRRYGQGRLQATLFANPRLREVIQTPDLIVGLTLAAGESPQETEPLDSAGRIYQVLVRRRFEQEGGKDPAYQYARVKRPVLAALAFRMLDQDQSALVCDDELYDQIARLLSEIEQRNSRRRPVLPEQWSVEALLEELFASEVIERLPGHPERLAFTRNGYRDYFAAVHIDGQPPDSPDLLRLIDVQRDTSQRWAQVLTLLLGFQPAASRLFDRLYRPEPQQAAQFWFETRPTGEVPEIIRQIFREQLDRLEEHNALRAPDLTTARVFHRMLNSPYPAQRLSGAVAISQWGIGEQMIGRLLDVASDPHPLVRAVGEYALLRLGEPAPFTAPARPLPPLIDLFDDELRFRACGGCNATLGPLTLVQVPDPATVHVDISLTRVDFRPLDEPAALEIDAPPPELLAAQLLETGGTLSWVDLLASYAWIARHTSQALALASSRRSPVLSGLAERLDRRARRYAAFGQLIAADLIGEALWRERTELAEAPEPADRARAEAAYAQMRRRLARANQARIVELAAQSRDVLTGEAPVFELDAADGDLYLAREQEPFQLEPEEGSVQAPGRRFTHSNTRARFSRLAGRRLVGQEYSKIEGTGEPLPIVLRMNVLLQVDRVERSDLVGVNVRSLAGGWYGWMPRVIIKVDRWFRESRLTGVIATPEPAQEGAS